MSGKINIYFTKYILYQSLLYLFLPNFPFWDFFAVILDHKSSYMEQSDDFDNSNENGNMRDIRWYCKLFQHGMVGWEGEIMCGIGIHIQQDSSFLRLAAPQAARHYHIYLANLLILATESIEKSRVLPVFIKHMLSIC